MVLRGTESTVPANLRCNFSSEHMILAPGSSTSLWQLVSHDRKSINMLSHFLFPLPWMRVDGLGHGIRN